MVVHKQISHSISVPPSIN